MPFRHQYIKQIISITVIWLAFEAADITNLLTGVSGFGNLRNLITASVFIALYQLIGKIYDNWLWKIFHLKYAIDGQWVYALHSFASGRTVFGTFSVEQDANKIEIRDGMAWYSAEEPRGAWEGEIVYWNGNYIMFLFRMRSFNVTREGSMFGEINEGMFLMNYEKTPITFMRGAFNDLGLRSSSRGNVIMKKVNLKDKDKIMQMGLELANEEKPKTQHTSGN